MSNPATLNSEDPCPCGSGKSYGNCCEPLHLGDPAPTAERLMRSRYSAFCLGRIDYLLDTLHPSQKKPSDRSTLAQTIDRTEWVRLDILAIRAGGAADLEGKVEFVATFREAGEAGQLHERSTFLKVEGRWLYHSGEYESLTPLPRPGRNEPCWCGSGKKFKKCHLGR